MVIPFSLSVTSHLYGYMFDCAIVFTTWLADLSSIACNISCDQEVIGSKEYVYVKTDVVADAFIGKQYTMKKKGSASTRG